MRRLSSTMLPMHRFLASRASRLRPFSSAESRTQKLERIADELLSLNKIEHHDYSILYRLKLGLDSGAGISGHGMSVSGAASEGGAAAVEEAKEKTAFDVKLEKFDSAAKIKVIKEVRTFTDLGLKEAKEMVEKATVVLKKGVTKEEKPSRL